VQLPFASSSHSRRVIRPLLQSLVSHIDRCVDKPTDLSPPFRVALYNLLFECLKDNEEWGVGLALCTAALTRVSGEWRRSLWQYRVTFMSKLGQRVDLSQLKLNDSDKLTQARVCAVFLFDECVVSCQSLLSDICANTAF
jgi:hypothetical protein